MSWTNKFIFWGLILVLAFLSLSPFLWQFLTSVKPSQEVFAIPPTYLPKQVSVESYTKIFQTRPFARYILNSCIVALGTTVLCLLISSFASYALARLRPVGGWFIQRSFLVVALFPPTVLFVPLYKMISYLGLTNNPLSLIFCYTALNLPFAIWVLSAYFRQIPSEIEEAAEVDGFGRWRRLWGVILPLAAPAIATTAILVFIFSWNEFLLALTFMREDTARTVPVGIGMLSGVSEHEIPWDQISAAVVITTLPVVTAVLAFQRRIVEGLTAGAVKG
jgi:multiple sugar transport system permease protein